MFKDKSKYRSLIFIYALLYINFFLLSPFFHHHHEDDDSLKIEELKFHSHLVNDHDESHHEDDDEHHLHDDENHNHFVKLNSSRFLTLTKSIELSQILDFYITSFYPPEQKVKEVRRQNNVNLPSKLQREKYAYTASNLSPPLA